MDPDWKHLLKAILLFVFCFCSRPLVLGTEGSFLAHAAYILALVFVVHKYLLSCKLPSVANSDFNTLIVGAGFSGLGMAIKLKEMGAQFRILEKVDRVGGTWRDNIYPGCGCDVPSHLYSYSFHMNPKWSRSYAGQEEILQYIEQTVDHYGLANKIEFGKKVVNATWNPNEKTWRVKVDNGEVIVANVIVSAMGGLVVPNIPKFKGASEFKGESLHSARWNKNYKPTGKSVAVIGTGASAVQIIPSLAPEVERLYVMQRTPCWTGQKDDWAHPAWLRLLFKVYPPAMHLLRLFYFWRSELIFFLGFRMNSRTKFIMKKMLSKYITQQVHDPELLGKLIPDYEVGCKRITPSNSYIQCFNRRNVTLVTDPIDCLTRDGIRTKDSQEIKVDTIVYATGFSISDHVQSMDVRALKSTETKIDGGEDTQSHNTSVSLLGEWGDEPNAYLGMVYPGFPNLYYILGPGTGLGVGSLMLNLEVQFSYICQCVRYMIENKIKALDIKTEVNDAYKNWARECRKDKAFAHPSCTSWYRNSRGESWIMWPTQPFLYWWYARRMNPKEFNELN